MTINNSVTKCHDDQFYADALLCSRALTAVHHDYSGYSLDVIYAAQRIERFVTMMREEEASDA